MIYDMIFGRNAWGGNGSGRIIYYNYWLSNGRESVSWPPTSQDWSHSIVHGHPCI